MKKHKYILVITAFIFSMFMVLSGCGGNGSNGSNGSNDGNEAEIDQSIKDYYADLGFQVEKIEIDDEGGDPDSIADYVKVTMTTDNTEEHIKELFESLDNDEEFFGATMFRSFLDSADLYTENDDSKIVTKLDINGDIYEMDIENDDNIVMKNGEVFAVEGDDSDDIDEDEDENVAANEDYDDDEDEEEDYDSSSSSEVSHYDICYFIIDRQDYFARNGWEDGKDGHDSFADAQAHFGITYDQVIDAWTDYDANMSALDAYY